MGDGAGNQAFVDEVNPEDGVSVAVMKYANGTTTRQNGYVAVAHSEEPSLERPNTTFAGRALYFAFGLEGVNDDTGYNTKSELLGRAADWLQDNAMVVITPTVAAANRTSYFVSEMTSEFGGDEVSTRWDFGDGSGFAGPVDTNSMRVGHIYRQPGTYTVRVEATNRLGTRAMAETTVVIPLGLEYIDTVIYLPSVMKNYVWPEEGAAPPDPIVNKPKRN
jgi:PKD repeat protein